MKHPLPGIFLLLLINFQSIDAQPIHFNQSPLGEHVFVFDPCMDMQEVQACIDTIFVKQNSRSSEFSINRYALLFKPGRYELDIRVGYYMQVAGLGESPEDVVIVGAVRSNSRRGTHVLTNFWRSVENMTVVPTEDSANVWGVSQASPMRRVHIKGNLQLHDNGYASGGFLADSKIDGMVLAGGQQQWFSRNSAWGKWKGGAWNVLSLGVIHAPLTNFPDGPYTSIDQTPVSREKPYLVYADHEFRLKIPESRENSAGPSWENHQVDPKTLKIEDFYIAIPGVDDSRSMNQALKEGRNLLITPGIYNLESSLKVSYPGSVIVGLGMPSLVPLQGTPALEVSDVDGVIVSGLLMDAGKIHSESLFVIGEPGSGMSHAPDPSWLYDIFCRVGGPAAGSATSCVIVNSSDVFIDHIWLWRADHGNGVAWDVNRCANGIIVNGDDVTIYGLFNEHHQEYQTIWNGAGGRVYLYQSEMPYDPPTVESWKHDTIGGYASYKVAGHVQSHEAWGVGVYNVFHQAPVVVETAIETPESLEDNIHHKFTFWLGGNESSVVRHIINGKGGSVYKSNRKAVLK
ncbi:MAG: coagulation factor 5/8 type domain-containing protein [Bacteroidota bacterium]